MNYLKGRWEEMGRGRRVILLIQPAMFIVFLAVYLIFGRQQVVSYRDSHLRYEQQGDAAVYSGRAEGYNVKYVVSPGPVVEFWLDGALDSTYTVTEDPTAIPETDETAALGSSKTLTGIEIRKDGGVWFRGAYSSYYWLLDENGRSDFSDFIVIGGTTAPAPDPAPIPKNILSFAQGPEISPRGYGLGLLLGLLLSGACAVSLLFEDQLFRWQMSFRIQDPYDAEPSDWELLGRWVGWVALTGCALVLYALAAGLWVF